MKVATPASLKSPRHSQQPPLKVEVLSSTPSMKIWLEAQPPSAERGGGVAHYYITRLAKKPDLE